MEITKDISELIYQKGFFDCLAVFRPKRRFISKSMAARYLKSYGYKNPEKVIDRMHGEGMISIRKPGKARNAKWLISVTELMAALIKMKCSALDVNSFKNISL